LWIVPLAAGIVQRFDFGVRLTGLPVPATTEDNALADNEGADQGIG
jgi:hypothetical protein